MVGDFVGELVGKLVGELEPNPTNPSQLNSTQHHFLFQKKNGWLGWFGLGLFRFLNLKTDIIIVYIIYFLLCVFYVLIFYFFHKNRTKKTKQLNKKNVNF